MTAFCDEKTRDKREPFQSEISCMGTAALEIYIYCNDSPLSYRNQIHSEQN